MTCALSSVVRPGDDALYDATSLGDAVALPFPNPVGVFDLDDDLDVLESVDPSSREVRSIISNLSMGGLFDADELTEPCGELSGSESESESTITWVLVLLSRKGFWMMSSLHARLQRAYCGEERNHVQEPCNSRSHLSMLAG